MNSRLISEPDSYNPVIQLSIHADNKVGRLNELLGLLNVQDIHIMAISILDTTDSSIVRMVVDYTEKAQQLLASKNFSFVANEIIAVEIKSEAEIHKVTSALVQAEINIHYIYAFVTRPNEKYALAISLEDNDLARETLNRHQLKVIGQNDITR